MKKITILLPILLTFLFADVLGQQPERMQTHTKAEGSVNEYSVYQSDALWTNQRNEIFQLREFIGKPAIVTMFYGNCLQVCPILIRDANRIYEAVDESLRDQVQVLAITFDPENDTPETLRNYAERYELNHPQWHFLTGSPAPIRELAMLLGVQYRKDSYGHYSHSNQVFVLDDDGVIIYTLEGLNQPVEEAADWIEEHLKSSRGYNNAVTLGKSN